MDEQKKDELGNIIGKDTPEYNVITEEDDLTVVKAKQEAQEKNDIDKSLQMWYNYTILFGGIFMEFNKEFLDELVKRINESCNFEDLDQLEKLLSIYSKIVNIETQKAQVEMLKESQEMMKSVDFSNLDLNKLLGK